MRIMLLLMIGSLVAPLLGAVEVREFDDLEKQTRYEHLLKEVIMAILASKNMVKRKGLLLFYEHTGQGLPLCWGTNHEGRN